MVVLNVTDIYYYVIYFCRPLIRTLDNLLIIGLLDDRDLYDLLCLINPLCFDIEYNNGMYNRMSQYDFLYSNLVAQ